MPLPTFENWHKCHLQRGCGSYNGQTTIPSPRWHLTFVTLEKLWWSPCTYIMSWPRRDRQRLQVTALLSLRGLVYLTSTQAFSKWIISSYMHGQWYLLDTTLWWLFVSPLWPAMELWYFSLKTNSLNLHCGKYIQLCVHLSKYNHQLDLFKGRDLYASVERRAECGERRFGERRAYMRQK
jgi:hypothetical protein